MYTILKSLSIVMSMAGHGKMGLCNLSGDLVPLQTKDTIVYYTMCATEQDEHSDMEMEDLMNMETDEDETHNTERIRRLYICPVVP